MNARPVWPVSLAGRLFQFRGAGHMAVLVQPQHDGRRHRRISLVPAGGTEGALSARLPTESCRRCLLSVVWCGDFLATERTFADMV